jgi:hypothetical protein
MRKPAPATRGKPKAATAAGAAGASGTRPCGAAPCPRRSGPDCGARFARRVPPRFIKPDGRHAEARHREGRRGWGAVTAHPDFRPDATALPRSRPPHTPCRPGGPEAQGGVMGGPHFALDCLHQGKSAVKVEGQASHLLPVAPLPRRVRNGSGGGASSMLFAASVTLMRLCCTDRPMAGASPSPDRRVPRPL